MHTHTHAEVVTVSRTGVVSLAASLVAVGVHGDAVADIADV